MQLIAHAKINWTLSIQSRRADGYHLLDMLLSSVQFGDTISLEEADEITLSLSGRQTVPGDASNLAVKAAVSLKEAYGVKAGASIRLAKRIPVGAGLGGGSADAAAVLLGLTRLWGLDASGEELASLAATIGSDVPFCLVGGQCRVSGVGDRLRQIDCAYSYDVVIVQPCRGLSTQAVFSAYDRLDAPPKGPDTDKAVDMLVKGDALGLSRAMGNALHAAAVPMRPEIAVCAQTLEHFGALRAQMTGSGSAVIGLFESTNAAKAAYGACAKIWPKTILTRTAPYGVSMVSGKRSGHII